MSGLMLVMNDSLTSATVDYVVPGSAATDAGLAVETRCRRSTVSRRTDRRSASCASDSAATVSESCSRCVAAERRER
jgi:hypothetical protein